MEDFYSPSWTYIHWDFSPLGTNSVALPLGAPLDHNSSQNALLQQEQGKKKGKQFYKKKKVMLTKKN